MLYPIKRNEKYGFIDEKNQVIIDPKFDYVGNFSNDVCYVSNRIDEVHFEMDNKVYYHVESSLINLNGEILFPFKKHLVIKDYFDDVAFCYNPILKKHGVIDKIGNEVIPFGFNTSEIEYSKFSNGLAKIKKNEKYGFINKINELIIPCVYDKVSHFKDGFALAKIKTKEFLINTQGEIFKSKFKIASTFNDGLAIVKQDKKFGFINSKNELVIDYIFDGIWGNFKNNKCLVKKNNHYGLIDEKGNIIIDFLYKEVRSLGNDVFPAKINKKWTLLNINGSQQFEPKFEYINDFEKTLYCLDYQNAKLTSATLSKNEYYIDVYGNLICEVKKNKKTFEIAELIQLLNKTVETKQVWDKAEWSYDGFSVTKKGAIKPFYFILKWFKKMNLLTDEGIESYNDKNNLEIGLYRFMFKEDAAKFLDIFYDYWYKKQHISNYQIDPNLKFENEENLDEYWEHYKKSYC